LAAKTPTSGFTFLGSLANVATVDSFFYHWAQKSQGKSKFDKDRLRFLVVASLQTTLV